jgi:ElaA protein
MIDWQWCRFESLSTDQLYEIVSAREAVFVVEQNCPYLDADGLDRYSWHLTGWKDGQVAAYSRVVEPGIKYAEPSLGRVLTTGDWRRKGLGKELLQRAIEKIEEQYPGQGIRISAQQYLDSFYAGFGFERVSEPYDEDGIPHIEMVRPRPNRGEAGADE